MIIVLWAQRSDSSDPKRNIIYLTINVQDVDQTTLKLDITSTGLDLKGVSTITGDDYALNIDFYKPIVTNNIRKTVTGSHVSLTLSKVELGDEYWPRLTKEKLKYRNIRTDFDKWVDEDEQELEELDQDNGLEGVEDLQQFREQNLDFSGLTEKLGLQSGANISQMKDSDFSDSDGEEVEEDEEEGKVEEETE